MKRTENREKRTELISESEVETMKFAEKFSKTLKGGEIILLDGELGAGKSTFVRGLARAFGIREPVRSPTFTLMHVHRVKRQKTKVKSFVHIDAYRLSGPGDLRSLGVEEYLGREDTIILVEWGKRVRTLFRSVPVQEIEFHHGKTINERIIYYGLSTRARHGRVS